ncbi:hypothetical protein GbCGDNIH6_8172 [Granulibacter bethesdensis]|nr:hypothetical protein GbCGDNIH6_8172 [Granulibacter bethesdensis]
MTGWQTDLERQPETGSQAESVPTGSGFVPRRFDPILHGSCVRFGCCIAPDTSLIVSCRACASHLIMAFSLPIFVCRVHASE